MGNKKRGKNAQKSSDISAALELFTDTKKILECPVCLETCRPPTIWQCKNGHLTCDRCHNLIEICPLCRSAFSEVRPYTAEMLAQKLPIECRNSSHGCKTTFLWKDKDEHEESCDFAYAHCPFIRCSVQVPIKDVLEHVGEFHNLTPDCAINTKKHSPTHIEAKLRIAITQQLGPSDPEDSFRGPMLIFYDDTPFFFVMSRESSGGCGFCYLWLWIVGTENVADQFWYTLTVTGWKEEITYTGKPMSLQIPSEEITSNQRCLLLSDVAVKRIMSLDGQSTGGDRLTCTIKIFADHSNECISDRDG